VEIWRQDLAPLATFSALMNEGGSAEGLELIDKGRASLALAHSEVLRRSRSERLTILAPLFRSHLHLFVVPPPLPAARPNSIHDLEVPHPAGRRWRIMVGPVNDEADLLATLIHTNLPRTRSTVDFAQGSWEEATSALLA